MAEQSAKRTADRSGPLEGLRRPFTFAVVGDLHYARPPQQTALSWRTSPDVPEEDLYTENVAYALRPMMQTLAATEPAFVLFTGDLYEPGDRKTPTDDDVRTVLRFLSEFGLPLLFARGHRDPEEHFTGRVANVMKSSAGVSIEKPYYSVDAGECRLVTLDTTGWDDGQAAWLEELLDRSIAEGVDRLFLFGHHPIWPVSRAFYSRRVVCEQLPGLLRERPIDAYFCGHSHDQSMVLRRTEGRPVLQCMGAPIGVPEEMPTPLDRVHATLLEPDDMILRWAGYLENTAPGWFLVHVTDAGVRVEWHHLHRGVEASMSWNRRGDIQRFWEMEHPEDARLIRRDLPLVRRAFLRYCAWDASRPGKRVKLNGEDIGDLPYGAHFAPRRLELPPRGLERLDVINRIEINAPGVEASTVGNLQIEAILPGGRVVRTRPTGEIFTWSDRWSPWKSRNLVKVMAGRPIRTVLSFR